MFQNRKNEIRNFLKEKNRPTQLQTHCTFWYGDETLETKQNLGNGLNADGSVRQTEPPVGRGRMKGAVVTPHQSAQD